jgi:hypothetical protein
MHDVAQDLPPPQGLTLFFFLLTALSKELTTGKRLPRLSILPLTESKTARCWLSPLATPCAVPMASSICSMRVEVDSARSAGLSKDREPLHLPAFLQTRQGAPSTPPNNPRRGVSIAHQRTAAFEFASMPRSRSSCPSPAWFPSSGAPCPLLPPNRSALSRAAPMMLPNLRYSCVKSWRISRCRASVCDRASAPPLSVLRMPSLTSERRASSLSISPDLDWST